ncbi:MAG: hypothetical protein WC205_09705 [Opitutaceae bacterium]
MIAAGLSPFAPDKAAFEAGRIMLNRLRELAAKRVDFSFETTLSGRAYAPLLKEMREVGYRIWMDFLWIPELGITRSRVKQRGTKGGHNIPDEVQQRRFHLGVRNLATLYRQLLDKWRLYDNTHEQPYLVASEQDGVLTVVDAGKLAQIESAASISLTMDAPNDWRVEEPAALTSEEVDRRSMRAMRKAYADAVLENLRFGLPIIQYRDGQIVEVPAEDLAPQARRILEANGELLPEEVAAGLKL